MPLNRLFAAIVLASLLALAGCSRTGTDATASTPGASAEAPALEASWIDSTWQGVLPCADCDGIQTRLRLVADDQGRRYELQETYLAQDSDELFEGQGAWTQETAVLDDASTVVYRLDIEGASRWFSLQSDGSLEMLEGEQRPAADGLAYRLQRR